MTLYGCIRVKVSPDNRNAELCRGVMHPFHDKFLHGGLGNGEYIHHRDGVTAHRRDIMDIDKHRTVPGPIRDLLP